ncbi:F-box domain-containing protein [Mycena chlorophos]|uniref:F-box domain-containing protein n=1 Tax=Mycena chlorophos TaxID=658473 RepID=A0A8H6VZV4_MYCCL|nr:F-box domain-containing protein [Mycena chlorophos]
MSTLTDLSVELLQELITHVDEQDLAPLRLVSKHLTLAVDPRFFRTLILLSNRLNAGMLEGVGMENRVWEDHVREVVVAPGNAIKAWGSSVEEKREAGMEMEQQRRMASALANLRVVHTVRFKITQNDPDWLMPTIFAALPHYALRTLDLIVDYADVVLPPILCDQLETLSVVASEVYAPRRQQSVVEGPKPPTLSHQVARIVAQNHGLRALYLMGRNDWEDVYDVLLSHPRRLKLKTVQTDTLTAKLFAYLRSYTGLERLRLLHHDATAGSREANDKEAEEFFSSVVPKHAETLRELRCVPAFESAWGFGAWSVGSFQLLRELRTLEVGVNEWGDRPGRVEWENAIPLLLHTVRALPHLTHFSITSTMSESARGARCGDLAMSHREYMARAVEQAVCEVLSESQSEFAGGKTRTRIVEDMDGYKTGMGLPPETGEHWDFGIRKGPNRRRRTPVEEKAWSRWTGRVCWAGRVVRSP